MAEGVVREAACTSPARPPPAPVDPDSYSSLFKTLLWWNAKVVSNGYSTPLSPSGSPVLMQHLRCSTLGSKLAVCWQAEQRDHPTAPSLPRAVFKMLRKPWVIGNSLACVDGMLACVCRPLVLRYFVGLLQDASSVETAEWVGASVHTTARLQPCPSMYSRTSTGRRGDGVAYTYAPTRKSLYADVGSTDDVITIEGRVPHCGD